MIRTIDITLLPQGLRGQVLEAYRQVLKTEDRRLTMEEAAGLYGFTYQTIRSYVAARLIRTTGRGRDRRIRHKDMRAYLKRRQQGHPRRAQLEQQTAIPAP